MRWRPLLKCPFCGGALRNEELYPGKPLVCPSCSQPLQIATWHAQLNGYIALVLTLILCLLLGFRGIQLFVSTVILWLPVRIIWAFVSIQIFGLRFESYTKEKAGISLFHITPKDDARSDD